jgi:hypothetical protein
MSEKPIQILTSLPSEWKLLIAETKQLNGILVFQTPFGKVYTRLMSEKEIIESKGRFVFEILNPQTMKTEYNFNESEISIQEAFLQKQGIKKPYYVQESVSETEEERLKRIREESEKFMEDQKQKNKEININFYSEKPKTNEKLENVENPSEISDKEIADNIKDVIIEKYSNLNLQISREDLDSKEKIEKAIENLKTIERRDRRPPSGTIPLNAQQAYGLEPTQETQDLIDYEGSVLDLSFDSHEQMIEVLKKRDDEESKRVLQELLNKLSDSQKRERTGEWEYQGSAKDLMKRKNKWVKKK